ncbi:putative ribonuclease H-like domain-containing protein [Tanacetum coccineum]
MVEKPVLNNKGRVTGQREIRLVWNNAQRVNHQNKLNHPHPKRNFVPTAVATKSGQVPVNAAKQSSPRATTSISTARPVNIAAPKPKINDALPITYSYFQAHSLVKKPINKRTTAIDINFNKKINTAKVNNVTTTGPKGVVSAAEGNGENVVKSLACWIWRPTGNVIDHISKDNGSYILKRFDYVDLQGRLNGCSRHMTGNKSFLTDYQEIDGGFVAFGGSPKGGKITRKEKQCSHETKCLVLSPDFDESQVLLKVPRQNNMYSFDLKNVVPSGGLTCLFAKATIDESNLWHRRLGHINFKTMNKLVRGNLVRGLPSKLFENDHTCVACQKGKQHKASCKTKLVSSISQPLQMLHMDLFGPTFIRSINHKIYCLVVTDDFSRFSWVFFLDTKEETSGILKTFITGIENQINRKVKIIRCDNGTEFKNNDINQFCGMKWIKREFSVARTPQQNRVANRKNKTLIEAARTMLADSFLPTTFWAEVVNTACYVQNRVLVTKPHNKKPYELLHGRPPSISFMRPFRYPVTILNTLDPLGKFDGKAYEGFLVGYSINSKAFRVFNTITRKVEENLHITFLENKPNVAGSGPDWLFDIDLLTNSMNYEPVTTGNQTNRNAGIKHNVDVVHTQQYILLPLLFDSPQSSEDAVVDDDGKKTTKEPANKGKRNGQEKEGGASNKEGDQNVQDLRAELDKLLVQQKEAYANSTNRVSTISPSVSVAGGAYDNEDVGAEADLNNLETTMNVSPIPTTRIHKDHPKEQIIGDPLLATKIRRMTKISEEHAMKVWTLVDLPNGKRAIGTKRVFRNKKDERGIIVRNKARPVAQGYTQEEGIDYDEVFAPIARIEAIGLFLAYASFMVFIVYQMDVKSAFLYGTIEEEVYVCQPPGFEDPQFPDKVYKVYVDDIIFGSTKKSLCVEFEHMMHKRFQMSSMGELNFFLGLQVKQKDDGFFISQNKYVVDILKKFDFSLVKITITPIETNKALLKDKEAEDMDVYLYRSMIGSLMYLTASRPDIMFAVCACARFQVTPKVSHLHAVKRIFRYLKGQPKLGLWYPRDSPFDLEAFSDSDYVGASLDRKSTTGGCQFLGKRLISWQCKKQTIVANSTTEAEYVAATNYYGQVLWIQNQMLDYGFNFMNTKIYFDNESTICIMKNPVFYSKTKHTEIRHHFIRDSYKKRLIQVIKIHTDHNVADLLTKMVLVMNLELKLVVVRLMLLGERIILLRGFSVNIMVSLLVGGNAEFHQIVDFLTTSSIHYALTQIHATVDGKTVVISESSVRSDLYFNHEDGTVTPLFASMLVPQVVEGEGSGQPSKPQPPSLTAPPSYEEQERMTEWLEAEQESGNIHKTRSTTTLNEPSPQGTGSGSGPRCQDTTLGDADAQTRSGEDNMEHQDDLTDFVPPTPHDSPLSGGHTPGSDEGRPNINELMAICTKLSNRVLALETSKTAQDLVIKKLKKKVKRLEKKQRARTPGMKLFKIGTSRRKSLDKENVSKQGRNLKTRSMFEEGDFDDDFDDIDDMGISYSAGVAIKFDDVHSKNGYVAILAASLQEEELEQFSFYELSLIFRFSTIIEDKSLEEIQKLYEREKKWINDFVLWKSEMEAVKKQKLEDDAEKEELRACLDIVPGDDIAINVESLATKYPIVDWKTHILTENMMCYQIIRADGSFHVLLMDTGVAIHMMVEKKYPLTQEMLSRMLNRRLEVDHESTMAFELIRFIKAQLEE